MSPEAIIVEALTEADRGWADEWLTRYWGSPRIVSNGVMHDLSTAPGVIAWVDGARAGMLNYDIAGGSMEITSLFSIMDGIGVGTALIQAALDGARQMGLRRVWLVTTNDNTRAMRFYQRRGFTIAAVRLNQLELSRRLKPELALTGDDDIPLRDEFEFEVLL
ncbi:MAG: GNAT family N-acetyltransferase [Anaerolineae bacterium]|nr:GNAT family N-acetyltransferase [Anaerolineae bacterium]